LALRDHAARPILQINSVEKPEFSSSMVQTFSNAAGHSSRPSAAARVSHPGQPKFGYGDAFYRELCRRVDDYFQRTGKNRRDRPRMYWKTAIVLAWFTSSYLLLVFVART